MEFGRFWWNLVDFGVVGVGILVEFGCGFGCEFGCEFPGCSVFNLQKNNLMAPTAENFRGPSTAQPRKISAVHQFCFLHLKTEQKTGETEYVQINLLLKLLNFWKLVLN